MKKMLRIIPVAIIAFALAGCSGEKGDPGRDGFVNFYDEIITVRSDEWTKYSDTGTGYNAFYESTWDVPALSRYICENGVVMAYMVGYDKNGIKYDPLPFTIWFDDGRGAEDSIYETTINYNFGEKRISFFFSTSDFLFPAGGPGEFRFRIVMMW